MKSCVLHVGMHKTGTTSIQHSLFYYLSDPDFHYIDLGSPNMSGKFLTMYRANPEKTLSNRLSGDSKDKVETKRRNLKARLFQQFEVAADRIGVISAESISNLTVEELECLKQDILKYTKDIHVVAYVRAPLSYVSSAFQENIKSGDVSLSIESALPRYSKLLNVLSVFGEHKATVRVFERNKLVDKDVVRDFCQTIGAEFEKEFVIHNNESLCRDALVLLHHIQKSQLLKLKSNDDMNKMKRLIAFLSAMPGQKLEISPLALQPFQQRILEQTTLLAPYIDVSLLNINTDCEDTAEYNSISNVSQISSAGISWLKNTLALDSEKYEQGDVEPLTNLSMALLYAIDNKHASRRKSVRLIDVITQVEQELDEGIHGLTRPQIMRVLNHTMLKLEKELQGIESFELEGLHGKVASIAFSQNGVTKKQIIKKFK